MKLQWFPHEEDWACLLRRFNVIAFLNFFQHGDGAFNTKLILRKIILLCGGANVKWQVPIVSVGWQISFEVTNNVLHEVILWDVFLLNPLAGTVNPRSIGNTKKSIFGLKIERPSLSRLWLLGQPLCLVRIYRNGCLRLHPEEIYVQSLPNRQLLASLVVHQDFLARGLIALFLE